jgi:transcription termination factor NusB
MNELDDKIERIREDKWKIEQLDQLIRDMEYGIKASDGYKKAVDKFSFAYHKSVFCNLLAYIGVEKYKSYSGNHLLKYSNLDYDVEMMSEILEIVIKRKAKMEDDLKEYLKS